MRLALRAVIVAALFPAVTGAALGQCPQFLGGQQVGTLKSGSINEASGIAASRKNAGVLWVHNDSGDSARVFAINTKGIHLGIYNFKGAGAQDWEDIAIGPGPDPNKDYLYIGDIGDNASNRSFIKVYRVPEPVIDTNQSPADVNLTGVKSIRLKYPDGARNAEALMVDPITSDLYIISKEASSKIYHAVYPQSTTQVTTMELVATLPWGWAVGGDISRRGDMIIVKGYYNASVWHRPAGTHLWEAFNGQECQVPLIWEPQGEAICFDANGCGYYTVSEGSYQPIYYFARDEKCPMLTSGLNDNSDAEGGHNRR